MSNSEGEIEDFLSYLLMVSADSKSDAECLRCHATVNRPNLALHRAMPVAQERDRKAVEAVRCHPANDLNAGHPVRDARSGRVVPI